MRAGLRMRSHTRKYQSIQTMTMNNSIRLLAALQDLGVWNPDEPLQVATKPLPGLCTCGKRISENKRLCRACKENEQ